VDGNNLNGPNEHDDDILRAFLVELERAADSEPIVHDFTVRYPQLRSKIQELVNAGNRLAATLVPPKHHPTQLGEFRIVRWIAKGGQGDVYEALQVPLGRRVAVKTIRRDSFSPMAQSRFEREQTVLARLHQTHIVPIHTAGREGGLQYFAMPFIEGVTLRRRIEALRDAWIQPDTSSASKSESARRLPLEHFRLVARMAIDVAEALQHAHDANILHRDMNPSNVMVDTDQQCWIIDFGLAAYLRADTDQSGLPAVVDPVAGVSASRGQVGTFSYMAPEQWSGGPVSSRTDVWGLGVTMFELLCLQQAFPGVSRDEIEHRVMATDPPWEPARALAIPSDLIVICEKALKKSPNDRYPSAQCFADDLRRWLRNEPTTVRSGAPRRVYLWARRNKGWAASLAIMLIAAVALAAQIGISQERNREAHRQQLIRQIQGLRQSQRSVGWSERTWSLAREAAALRREEDLRNQAAACLLGLDAKTYQEFTSFDSSAVLFDRTGERLLIGGARKWMGSPPRESAPARVWSAATGEQQIFHDNGPGPVAWSGDKPLRLIVDPMDRLRLRLMNLDQRVECELRIPGPPEPAPLTEGNAPVLALAGDGRFLAAFASILDGTGTLIVWDLQDRSVVRHEPQIKRRVSALAVDGDAAVIATGDEEGGIMAWPFHEGDAITLPVVSRGAIQCLTIHRDPVRRNDRAQTGAGWLLAAGDDGGSLAIWDLGRQIPRAFCHGSTYSVGAVAFSPDGAVLASGGRGEFNVKLWDVASGHLLLNISLGNFCTGLAFSSDGRSLAASNKTVFGGEGGVFICKLDSGRGIRSLRGLTGQIAQVRFSPSGKLLAGLSHDWRVGIWDVDSGSLLHVLDTPGGFASDNAALAFSPDGDRFAFAAGSDARIWRLVDGGVERTLKLPPGLHDALAFDAAAARLMLCRVETKGGVNPPFGNTNFTIDPRVCRVRDLLAENPVQELVTIENVNTAVHSILAAPDASYFVVTRSGDRRNESEFVTRIFAGFSGNEMHSFPGGPQPWLDPGGRLLFLPIASEAAILEMPIGKFLDKWDSADVRCLNPGASYAGGFMGGASSTGFCLGRRGMSDPLVTMNIDRRVTSVVCEFSADGRFVAWGNADGTVCICNIRETQQRLAEIGLGWE
jgi:serine/threonine protein kinase/WD40 repeat protein